MRWIGTELEEPDFVLAMKAYTRGSLWQAQGRTGLGMELQEVAVHVFVVSDALRRVSLFLPSSWDKNLCTSPQAGRHREDLQPDCRAYTSAIDACRRVGAWPQAVQVLADMEEMTVTPDVAWNVHVDVVGSEVVTYNAIMAACEKGREYPAAEKILAEFDRWEARQNHG
eukprot:Skav204355  [mRNA]  locus=scaffold866:31560:32552:+ [translate_table: standard]